MYSVILPFVSETTIKSSSIYSKGGSREREKEEIEHKIFNPPRKKTLMLFVCLLERHKHKKTDLAITDPLPTQVPVGSWCSTRPKLQVKSSAQTFHHHSRTPGTLGSAEQKAWRQESPRRPRVLGADPSYQAHPHPGKSALIRHCLEQEESLCLKKCLSSR